MCWGGWESPKTGAQGGAAEQSRRIMRIAQRGLLAFQDLFKVKSTEIDHCDLLVGKKIVFFIFVFLVF